MADKGKQLRAVSAGAIEPLDYVVNHGRVLSVERNGVFLAVKIEGPRVDIETGRIVTAVGTYYFHEADDVVLRFDI